jgi:ATP-dependent DNA helicase RecG
MKLDLNTPVLNISRVGKSIASRLQRLGIETTSDLIFYYPFRWQDFSQISEIAKLTPAEAITVKGQIQLIKSRRSPVKRKILTEALVADDSGSIKAIWFNQPFLTKILKPGDEVYLSGKVDFDRYNLQLINPIYEKANQQETTHTARLVPIYSLTSNLTQKQIRFLVRSVLPLIDQIVDWLPPELIKDFNLVDQHFALNQIHFPQNWQLLEQAIKRLKFDELFLFQLQVLLTKLEIRSSKAKKLNFYQEETKIFVDSLPFKLTEDQRRVAWQIISDLTKDQPMNRLLEGEVGSGKTIVAALALLNVMLNQQQGVLMVPTEILAKQHYDKVTQLFETKKEKIALLTRSQWQIGQQNFTKKLVLEKIKAGEVNIIIGTHALIQDKIEFENLVLAIIDEQHRFGVGQRQALKQKSGSNNLIPHLLSMTATPIPRSLALSLYGDLDLSVIKQLPSERKKIITKIVNPKDRLKAYEFIRQQVDFGRQIFVVCPLIDPSDKLGVKSATQEYDKLKKEIFSDLKISILHGRLKAADKEQVMHDFLAKKSNILVATAVVEVGVDVPNAVVMLVEGADRFGLAQLHQFRGRVGRSIFQSYCLLFTDSQSQKTKERLQALITAKDGFELAELDLKFRGPGEIYGTMQSGWPQFRLAKLTDYQIIEQAKLAAQKILQKSPDLNTYPLLQKKFQENIKITHLE